MYSLTIEDSTHLTNNLQFNLILLLIYIVPSPIDGQGIN